MIELKIELQTMYAAMQDDFPFVPQSLIANSHGGMNLLILS